MPKGKRPVYRQWHPSTNTSTRITRSAQTPEHVSGEEENVSWPESLVDEGEASWPSLPSRSDRGEEKAFPSPVGPTMQELANSLTLCHYMLSNLEQTFERLEDKLNELSRSINALRRSLLQKENAQLAMQALETQRQRQSRPGPNFASLTPGLPAHIQIADHWPRATSHYTV